MSKRQMSPAFTVLPSGPATPLQADGQRLEELLCALGRRESVSLPAKPASHPAQLQGCGGGRRGASHLFLLPHRTPCKVSVQSEPQADFLSVTRTDAQTFVPTQRVHSPAGTST